MVYESGFPDIRNFLKNFGQLHPLFFVFASLFHHFISNWLYSYDDTDITVPYWRLSTWRWRYQISYSYMCVFMIWLAGLCMCANYMNVCVCKFIREEIRIRLQHLHGIAQRNWSHRNLTGNDNRFYTGWTWARWYLLEMDGWQEILKIKYIFKVWF